MFRGLKKRVIQHMGSNGGSGHGGGAGRSSGSYDENDHNIYDDVDAFQQGAAARQREQAATTTATATLSSAGGSSNHQRSSHSGKAAAAAIYSSTGGTQKQQQQPGGMMVSKAKQSLLRSKQQQQQQQQRGGERDDGDVDGWMSAAANKTAASSRTAAASTSPSPPLSNFDKCIETSDAITASSSATQENRDTVLGVRRDPVTGLPDCSLLVSPDGHLLLVPTSTAAASGGGFTPEAMFRTERSKNSNNEKKSSNDKNQQQPPITKDDGTEQPEQKQQHAATKLPEEEQSATTNRSSDKQQQQQTENGEAEDDDDVGLNKLSGVDDTPQQDAIATTKNSFSELMRHGRDDYESAVFVGHDLDAAGDRALNRFSCRGWSVPATTLAVQQTGHGLSALAHFCEQLVLQRKEGAARTSMACDQLRREAASQQFDLAMGGGNNNNNNDQWEIIDAALGAGGGGDLLELGPNRVGPFRSYNSTLRRAVHGFEHYYHTTAERESDRWRRASLRGVLAQVQSANDQFRVRSRERQRALREISGRASQMEQQLRQLKRRSAQRWEAVYRAEAMVTQRVEQRLAERSRERQRRRLEQLRAQEEQEAAALFSSGGVVVQPEASSISRTTTGGSTGSTGTASATAQPQPLSEEVWNLVSSVADAHGSFEPVHTTVVESTSASLVSEDASSSSVHNNHNHNYNTGGGAERQERDNNKNSNGTTTAVSTSNTEASSTTTLLPIQSREIVEQEVGLPELRAAALRADDEIQDAADALLQILQALDTTRRSARIAAETCLVSAANAQAQCLRSLLQLERESLQERLRDLDGLEEMLDHVDVRADLDDYIAADKKASGGRSHLGDDDDGGIASALAILSSHVDGSMGHDSASSLSSSSDGERRRMSEAQTDSDADDSTSSQAKLSDAVDKLFEKDARLGPDADETDPATVQARAALAAGVDLLCQSAAGETSPAKARRSKLCYALNSKRTHAKLETQLQFDGVCRLFSAILDGCVGEKGVSNAKMMMMLSQTFYMEKQPATNDSEAAQLDESARQERKRRIYVKNQLVGLPIWAKDEFWDVALSQQISESLTHSGVMSNFDRNIKVQSTEWTQTRKPRWYDLTYMERSEAASQVHAVVFAQLGALAHSMIEFGCGLERSCAFVRRMSIRNQLPSSQRTMLLTHLMAREDVDRKETKAQLEAAAAATTAE